MNGLVQPSGSEAWRSESRWWPPPSIKRQRVPLPYHAQPEIQPSADYAIAMDFWVWGSIKCGAKYNMPSCRLLQTQLLSEVVHELLFNEWHWNSPKISMIEPHPLVVNWKRALDANHTALPMMKRRKTVKKRLRLPGPVSWSNVGDQLVTSGRLISASVVAWCINGADP